MLRSFFEETEVGMDLLRTVAAQVKEEKDTILFDEMSDGDASLGSDEEAEMREKNP